MGKADVALLCALAVSSCASAPELPSVTKPAVICLYSVLKSKTDIVAVDVYFHRYGPVVSYTFRDRTGKLVTTDLIMNNPDAAGRFSYSGDFMTPGNPVLSLLDEVKSKCHADGGWNDQVVITGPDNDPYRWRVDMSRYTN